MKYRNGKVSFDTGRQKTRSERGEAAGSQMCGGREKDKAKLEVVVGVSSGQWLV